MYSGKFDKDTVSTNVRPTTYVPFYGGNLAQFTYAVGINPPVISRHMPQSSRGLVHTNNFHPSHSQANEALLRETVKQLGVTLEGPLWPANDVCWRKGSASPFSRPRQSEELRKGAGYGEICLGPKRIESEEGKHCMPLIKDDYSRYVFRALPLMKKRSARADRGISYHKLAICRCADQPKVGW